MTVNPATGVAQTVFRIALGTTLMAHGSQKLFGWFGGGGVEGTSQGMQAMGFRPAKQNAILAGLGEAGAGAALALGLGTPAAGAGAAITMGVAASVHAPKGFFATEGGLEYPTLLAVAAATFALGGAGPYSLDAATGRVLDKPWMRAVALAAIPVIVAVQLSRRSKTLKAEGKPEASTTPAEEGSTDPQA